jgi:hypothetical protein
VRGALRIVFSFLFSLSLAAQPQRIVLDPPGPTSAASIVAEVYVTCDPQSHTLERLGNVIKIHVTPGPFASLCDPPVPARYPVSLGVLPSGEYRIDVTVGEQDSVESKTFVVRNGAAAAFEIRPFAVPTQPAGLRLRLDAGDLSVAKVFVDGVRVTDLTVNGAYWVPAPAHARGFADVTIETIDGTTYTVTDAIYYYDPSAAPDFSVFERILFPILVNTAGAHGSQWVSEAAIANQAHWSIKAHNDVLPLECVDCPLGRLFAPDSYVAVTGDGYPRGVALLVPRAESDNLAFSLRVRDTSREAEGYGTQVPVVREKDMFRGVELTLLDIPVDPGYRTRLRVYAFDTVEHDAHVTLDRGGELYNFFVPVRRTCSGAACDAIPWYAELDLPVGAAGDRVNAYVSIGNQGSPAWAFASITNDETQQVTIVTADGNGGRP